VLLTDPGRVFTQDQLIEALFGGENVDRATENLYGRVSQLRRALEPDLKRGVDSTFIHREGQGYCFSVDGSCWIDTVEYERLIKEGEGHLRSGQSADAIEAYEGAVGLLRGEFLESDRYEEWTLEVRELWQERYITALTQLGDAYASAGDCHRAVMTCRVAFDLRPARESVLQQLMRYYHASGDRSEALQVYKRGVEALKRDLDVKPSAETETLRQTVLEEPILEAVRDRTRIAVLPLVNVSPDPEDEYFADGMTEELIYSLSRIAELRVIAQTSSLPYKNTKKTVTQIGRELNIGSLLEGSVRKAGDMLRITVQLIDVGSDEHLWAKEFDRELQDVFSIQSEIAQEVAGALRVELLDEVVQQLEEEPTADLEAYILYLKGRHFLGSTDEHPIDVTQDRRIDTSGLGRAIVYFEKAIEADADYALAWSGLADSRCLLWFFGDVPDESLSRAEEAADRAVEHGPQLGEGYASQALVRWIGWKDVVEAERLLEKAVRLSPKNPTVSRWHARILGQLGRRGEAVLEMLRALEIDPLSPSANLELADLHLDAGRHDDAIRQTESILELHPSDVAARLRLAKFKMLSWNWEGAEAEYLRAIDGAPADPAPLLQYAELLLSLGRSAEGEAALNQGLALAGTPCPHAILDITGVLYYLLDDFARALQCFEQTITVMPRIRFSYWWSAICHWRLGNHEDALEWLRKLEATTDGFYRLSRDDMALGIEWARGLIYTARGDRVKARDAIERAKAFPEGMPRRSLGIAAILFHLGEADEGFVWLRQAVKERCPNLQRIRAYDLPEAVRKDARYREIMKPTGLVPEGKRAS
ncbi:BTAD domain-containing putative transcriptional regulator, partial [Candidatus Bipolaricaulota bacterium]